jgi:hypothetical protein
MPHLADSDFDGMSGDVYNEDRKTDPVSLALPLFPADNVAMRNRFRRKTLNLLLSALVLAWGILPPGVQHAHAGGSDATHRHDDCHEVAHHASHNYESDYEHHDHATISDVSLLVDYVLHLHWQFLGVEFSMPVPEEPADGNDDEGTVPPAIVRVMNEQVLTTQAGPSFGRVLLVGIYTPSADLVRNSEPVPCPPNLVTSIPLCDSARLERSRVLLA